MTPKQEAAMQQALDILDSEFTAVDGEFCRWCDGRLSAKHNCKLQQVITALRAALAEPEPVQEPVQKPDVPESSFGNITPVGWFEPPNGAFRANPQYRIRFPSQLLSWQIPLYTHPPKAEPEPVQEPVAWRYQDARGNYRYRGYVQGFDKEYSRLKPVPLYTTPPQRPLLTDEEVREISQQHQFDSRMEKFVRIIERKVRGENAPDR